jgi:hypothetical protein
VWSDVEINRSVRAGNLGVCYLPVARSTPVPAERNIRRSQQAGIGTGRGDSRSLFFVCPADVHKVTYTTNAI